MLFNFDYDSDSAVLWYDLKYDTYRHDLSLQRVCVCVYTYINGIHT